MSFIMKKFVIALISFYLVCDREEFKYLGTEITRDGKMEQEITARMGKGSNLYQNT